MLLLRTLEYYQLVLCEVSRLYVKKWLWKTPQKIKFLWKKYNGETAFKERPYFVESYQVKSRTYQIEILSTTNQINILAGNLQ